MSVPLSIRFEASVLDRLRRQAARAPGASVSGIAQRLVDEGLRMADHPGLVFKDGPSGRRAALSVGPDVWEVVRVLGEVDQRGSAAVEATASLLSLPEPKVRLALRYYTAYPGEIDAEIARADQESIAAERDWMTEQRLLA